MPRREVLTPVERVQLFAFPDDEGELIRLGTLSRTDLTFIRHHRGDHNRLGIAVQMTYLRYPSRMLGESEAPHPPLLGIVAAQLKVTPAAWSLYATRDETRREHLQELLDRSGLRQFTKTDYQSLTDWLTPLAMQTTQALVLARSLIEQLRARQVALPPVRVIEKLCAAVLTRAAGLTFRRLTDPLTAAHRTALDGLLTVQPERAIRRLAWLRQPPGAPSANAVLAHLSGLQARRDLNLPAGPRSGCSPEPTAAPRPRGWPVGRLPAPGSGAAAPLRDTGGDPAGGLRDADRSDPQAARSADRHVLQQGPAQTRAGVHGRRSRAEREGPAVRQGRRRTDRGQGQSGRSL